MLIYYILLANSLFFFSHGKINIKNGNIRGGLHLLLFLKFLMHPAFSTFCLFLCPSFFAFFALFPYFNNASIRLMESDGTLFSPRRVAVS